MMMQKKFFITGGTGFIGRRVVALLRERKHTVTLLKSRLADVVSVERELRRAKPDVVLHLAWEGIPDYGAAMSAKNLADGLGFFALLARLNSKKVVATGSCFEYDDKKSGHWAYTVAKSALRKMGQELFAAQGGVFVWAVPFYIYGAGKPPASLVPALITQARKGEVPVVKNDVWLDYVYIDDVVDALMLLIEKKVESGVCDIGTGSLTRIGEIASVVARLHHIVPASLRAVRKTGRVANVSALRKIGWRQKHSLSQGIVAMIREIYGKGI